MNSCTANPLPAERHWLTPEAVARFAEDVWCDACGDEHVRLLGPMQVHQGTRLFLIGRCNVCGAVHKAEVCNFTFPSQSGIEETSSE